MRISNVLDRMARKGIFGSMISVLRASYLTPQNKNKQHAEICTNDKRSHMANGEDKSNGINVRTVKSPDPSTPPVSQTCNEGQPANANHRTEHHDEQSSAMSNVARCTSRHASTYVSSTTSTALACDQNKAIRGDTHSTTNDTENASACSAVGSQEASSFSTRC